MGVEGCRGCQLCRVKSVHKIVAGPELLEVLGQERNVECIGAHIFVGPFLQELGAASSELGVEPRGEVCCERTTEVIRAEEEETVERRDRGIGAADCAVELGPFVVGRIGFAEVEDAGPEIGTAHQALRGHVAHEVPTRTPVAHREDVRAGAHLIRKLHKITPTLSPGLVVGREDARACSRDMDCLEIQAHGLSLFQACVDVRIARVLVAVPYQGLVAGESHLVLDETHQIPCSARPGGSGAQVGREGALV
mmetsp:Transcript_95201/g.204379  ORF Transcript_95201/g.204379 Transcript_95201/m.204379 type:complete len:251 (+) Transcript_95201:400-1152(+)